MPRAAAGARADTTWGQLGVLAHADNGRARFLATTIAARSGGLCGAVHVHAKIGIVDDAWLTAHRTTPRKLSSRRRLEADRIDALLDTPEGAALYRRRQQMIEPLFANTKLVAGSRGFIAAG